jgi:aminopeptidase C
MKVVTPAHLRSGAARSLKASRNDPAAKSRRFQYHETLKTHDIVYTGLGKGEAGVGEKRDVDVYGGTGKQRTSKKKK